MPDQGRLVARPAERLRRHIRRVSFDQQLPYWGEFRRFPKIIIALERHISSKGQNVSALDSFPRDVDRRGKTVQHDVLRARRVGENPHHVLVALTVVNHERLAGINGQLDMPAKCLFLDVQRRSPVRIMLDPVRVDAGLPHRHASFVRSHLRQTLPRRIIEFARARRVDRARREHAVIEMSSLQRQFSLVEPVADSADFLNASIDCAFNHRIHVVFGAGFGGGEVGVGVDKPSNSLGRNGRGARFLLRHVFQPILGRMEFHDIDAATRSQIDRDLAEAAVAGINGSIDDIVASFEETLGDYLALDPDLRRAYSRGDIARMYGTALGDAFIREHNFAWQLLIDDYGTDLVVTSPDHDMYTAPLVVVDTRFEDEKPGKLTAFIKQFLG